MMKTNKDELLLKFMGCTVNDGIVGKGTATTDNEILLSGYNVSMACYSVSWDWIMPVINKIESTGASVLISDKCCHITKKGIEIHECELLGKDDRLKAVYKAAIEFVERYVK